MDDDAQIFSVIGGSRRSGRWRVPASTRTLTLFGRCLIDLRQAETTADELSFSCVSAFAGVTFIVPEGAEVRPSGMAILGSARSLVPVSETPCHLPPISIDATTVFGRLRIRTTDEVPEDELRESWRERRRLKKLEKAAEKAALAEEARAAAEEERLTRLAEADARVDRTIAHMTRTEDDLGGVDLHVERSARAPEDDLGGVDLHVERSAPAPVTDDIGGVDLKPAVRPPAAEEPAAEPVDAIGGVRASDDPGAPDLFGEAPTPASGTVDPVPVGSIDDMPTRFVGDDQSPLEDLEVPDSADGIQEDATG